MKLRFLPFFRRFHATNRNLGSGNFVPPTIQPARNCLFVNRRLCAEICKFPFPTLRVPLFRFRHAQQNAFAFHVPLALGQITIGLRRLDLGLPVPLDYLDGLRSSFLIRRTILAAHNFQSAGSNAALTGGSILALNCCAVITSPTEPIIRHAAIKVRMVSFSLAKSTPSRTATIVFTYAQVATLARLQSRCSQMY